jgi:DNA-binding response OmpR family regulator
MGPASVAYEISVMRTGEDLPPAPRHVLYVDDNPMLTKLVERIFASDPAVAVHTAPDGATALHLAAQQQPDIVFLDLQLSDISGEVLLHQLRSDARTRSLPVVIVSGDTSPATIGRLIGLGAAGYLTKPFTAAQLKELVAAVGRPAAARSSPVAG